MYQKTVVLLHEFDNNIAVVATTVASIMTGISSFRQNNAHRGHWFAYRRGVTVAPAAAVGRGSAASGGSSRHLPTSVSPRAFSNDRLQVLRMPQANNEFPNANIENVTERSH